ncbi:exopolysaccharide transport family protein [Tautonia plasticadhaerens]|uniref:Tyrosine-protein kinase CpsD n=1 Tax=Tautonia plasticadhaerens TaxID=2527974 RepID=A0A518HFL0_9BACT|nr:tyrosine-protein kinase domain-containing protein [Tautonia plasticadhaerens]QDV39625.1 Tyrosine-protein kinase CpsD [Tautonia plasticadhaerens]
MDTADSPRPGHELARLTELPPALRVPPPPASRTSSPGGGLPINPRLVLRGLARHWWQALALWVVGTAALATLVYLRYEPTYRSSSMLRIETDPANPYVTNGGPPVRSDLQTQIQLITSANVLTSAVSDPDVSKLPSVIQSEDAVGYIREAIKVSPLPGGSLIEVSAESRLRHEAATIVNAVVDAFLKEDATWADARNRGSIVRLESYREELEAEIEGLQQGLFRLVQQSENPEMMQRNLDKLLSPGASGDGISGNPDLEVELSEYQRLHQSLLELEYEEIEAKAELEAVRREAGGTDPRIWVERRIEQVFLSDPDVRSLREGLKDIQVQIDEAQGRIRNPADPAVSRLKVQQQRLLERYNQLWADLEPALRAQLAAEETNPTQLVRKAEAQLLALQQKRELMKQRLDRIEPSTRSEGIEQLKVSFAATDLRQRRIMLDQVNRRIEMLEYESRGSEPIIVISEAKPGGPPVTNKRDKYLAVTPLAMLGLVLGLVTLVELRSGRVSGAEDLTGRLSAEIFAVPPLPSARSADRNRLEGPGHDPKFEQFVQQLDHLRVALCGEGGHDGRGRCVLITSAVGGEGKTTLAAQLAVRCAEAGASTVLIDADLRRATLGRLFEVPDCPGLSDVLRGDAQLEDALVPISQVGGCQLLPAGSPEPNPNRILRGKNFAPMLERLRRSFDVVIIDTSPVLPVPDALILGRLADGAVIATRHDQSRFPAVERANGLLTGAGIPVLGVVVNGARGSDRRFGGGYAAYTYRTDRMPDPAGGPSAG